MEEGAEAQGSEMGSPLLRSVLIFSARKKALTRCPSIPVNEMNGGSRSCAQPCLSSPALFLYQEQKYLLSLLENKQSCSVHGPFLSLVLLGLAYPRFRCRMRLFGSCVVTMTHLHVPSVLLDGVEDRSWLGR